MVTREDVESFMVRMGFEPQELDEGLWLVRTEDDAEVVINHNPPVLVFRLKVLDLPRDEKQCAELYRKLLELNATDLVHGAYGLEENDVILSETLELENLDYNEFQSTVESFQMAVAAHFGMLAPYRNC
jgi:hypothetical protein